MLSTLHRKNLQFAFTVPFRTVHLRASIFTRSVSQHVTDRGFARRELNLSEDNVTDRGFARRELNLMQVFTGNFKENVNV
jgi:hypothetical protein